MKICQNTELILIVAQEKNKSGILTKTLRKSKKNLNFAPFKRIIQWEARLDIWFTLPAPWRVSKCRVSRRERVVGERRVGEVNVERFCISRGLCREVHFF